MNADERKTGDIMIKFHILFKLVPGLRSMAIITGNTDIAMRIIRSSQRY